MISKYRKTKVGVINTMFAHQKYSSKKRNHLPPTYTKQELSDWLFNDWVFDLLYTNWCNLGYEKSIKPSIDRLDDSKGYSFDNIQLMTWEENRAKGHKDMRSGKITHGNNPQKAVLQYSKDNVFIKEYVSGCEAGRRTGVNFRNISECCLNKIKTSGGFIWKFKNGRDNGHTKI